jgi:hypothetical protein
MTEPRQYKRRFGDHVVRHNRSRDYDQERRRVSDQRYRDERKPVNWDRVIEFGIILGEVREYQSMTGAAGGNRINRIILSKGIRPGHRI